MTENIKIRIKESNMISTLPSLLFSHFDEKVLLLFAFTVFGFLFKVVKNSNRPSPMFNVSLYAVILAFSVSQCHSER